MKTIEVNKQSSICIRDKKVLYFDPLECEGKHDADYIFITHPHYDHFSLLAILEVKKEDTIIVTTKDIVEELLSVGFKEENIVIVKPCSNYVLKSLEFRTIPAYNIHKKYHPKDNMWVGYLVTLNGVVYYITGDTDLTSYQKEVKCDVLFVPIGGSYTMNYVDASMLTNLIKPKLVIPTHYLYNVGDMDTAKNFKSRINKGITCKILLKESEFDD